MTEHSHQSKSRDVEPVQKQAPDSGQGTQQQYTPDVQHILRMQSLYGNRHVYQQMHDLRIQRAIISKEDMMAALQKVTGLKELFKNRQTPQKESLIDHAMSMLDVYENQFQAAQNNEVVNNAMKLAAAVRGVGQYLSRHLGDDEDISNPWMAPEITQKLLEYYKPELITRLRSAKGKDNKDIVNLAAVLSSADPVMLFMTEKINEEEAAKKIHEMAQDAGQQPAVMFELLKQQYQMELGSYDKDTITQGTLPVHSTNPLSGEQDLIGEISSGHFEKLLNLDGTGKTQWTTDSTGKNQLDFQANALVRLNALQLAVTNFVPAVGGGGALTVPDAGGILTNPQRRQIQNVEQADATLMNASDVRGKVQRGLQTILNLLPNEASKLIDSYVTKFDEFKITISFPADKMFAEPIADRLIYQSALKRELNQQELAELFPTRKGGKQAQGEVPTVGDTGEDGMARHRGNDNYMRWRYEKDVTPRGYTDRDIPDLPEFAALSPSFDLAQGSDTTTSFAENQYGTSHFVLKSAVRQRAMYQLTAKGALHRNPLLLLLDIINKAQELDTAQVTRDNAFRTYNTTPSDDVQKPQRLQQLKDADTNLDKAKSKATQAYNVLYAMMLSITSDSETFLDQQQIEVQILGQMDLGRDVETIYLDPKASTEVQKNVQDFAEEHSITVYPTSQKPGVSLHTAQNIQQAKTDVQKNIHAYFRNKGGKDDSGTDFARIAQLILDLDTIHQNDQTLYNQLYREATTAYNNLGYFKQRNKTNKALLKQLQQHIVRIEP